MNTLSQRVAIKMKEQQLTQSELAVRVGVSQTTIHRVCTGQTLQPASIFELSSVLKVSPFWLKYGDIKEPKEDYLHSECWGRIPIFDLAKHQLTGREATKQVLEINAQSGHAKGLIWLRLEQPKTIHTQKITLPTSSYVLVDLNKKEVTDKNIIATYSYSEGIVFQKIPFRKQGLFSFNLFLQEKVLGTVIEIRFYP
ncbi:helix-turn-helix domain-containing protein [Marinomonas agarivorans]|nr:helix-turn-helix domain-containing protein [Marinomonas agarivorans]